MAYRPITDLLIDLPSWCKEDTLWSGDHSASSSPCNKVYSRVLLLTPIRVEQTGREWGWMIRDWQGE